MVKNLSDLIDIKFLQEFQDKFAATMGLAIITFDTKKPVTKPSNYNDFCMSFFQNNSNNCRHCIASNLKCIKQALKADKTIICTCHNGLSIFAIPIKLQNEPLGAILGGQVFTEKPDSKKIKQIINKLNVNEKKYTQVMKEVPVIAKEKLVEITQNLSAFTNFISKMAQKNYEITKQSKRNKILRNIVEILRSTLEPDEIKKFFLETASKYFEPDRCMFVDYDSETKKFLPFRLELLKSNDIPSFVGIDTETVFPEFCQKLKAKQRNIIVKDLEKTLSRKKLLSYEAVKSLEGSRVKSDYGLVVEYQGEIMGLLILHYIKEKRVLNSEEFSFLKVLRDNVGTALHLAELYEKSVRQTQREKLISNVLAKAISTFDINNIKQIVNEIGTMMKADRCYFVEADMENLKGKSIDYEGEYLSSSDIKSIIGYDFPSEDVKLFIDLFTQAGDLVVFDYEKMREENEEKYAGISRYSKRFEIKSGIGIPIISEGKLKALLAIEYAKEKVLPPDEELDFLRILGNQVGMVFNQIQLYKNTEKLAQREILIREITETIRQSLDINKTKKIISEIMGKTLKADRCFIFEYNEANDKILIVSDEYLSSDKILPYAGKDLNEHIPSLAAELKKGKRYIVNEKGATLGGEKVNLEDGHHEDVLAAIKEYKINSALVLPLFYNKKFLGDLVLHYVEVQHEISKEDLDFLNMLSDQIAIALHQSKLYEQVQIQAEREKISRNIIEILRSTLDREMIKYLFVKNIGKYFNADRVFFADYDLKTNKYLPIAERSEYLSSPAEISYSECDFSSAEMIEHIRPLMEKREILIPNWHGHIEKNPKTEQITTLYKQANVKSSYSFPVLYEGEILGYFCIEFTQKINELMQEDVSRIRNICTQAGIAIHHADLYLKAQEALKSKEVIIKKVQKGVKEPAENIMEKANILSEVELERNKQIEYLNNIIESCNELLDLTQSITE